MKRLTGKKLFQIAYKAWCDVHEMGPNGLAWAALSRVEKAMYIQAARDLNQLFTPTPKANR